MLREKGIPARSLKGGYTGWLFQQMQKESKKGDSEETENEAMEQRRKDIELSIRKVFKSVTDLVSTAVQGMKSVMSATLILALAFCINTITKSMGGWHVDGKTVPGTETS